MIQSWVLVLGVVWQSGFNIFCAERLSNIKPLLDGPKQLNGPSLAQDLNYIAHLAETFTEQRPKASKTTWNHLADSLDQEGNNDVFPE